EFFSFRDGGGLGAHVSKSPGRASRTRRDRDSALADSELTGILYFLTLRQSSVRRKALTGAQHDNEKGNEPRDKEFRCVVFTNFCCSPFDRRGLDRRCRGAEGGGWHAGQEHDVSKLVLLRVV